MSNVENSDVNAIAEDTLPHTTMSTVTLSIYDGLVAELGDPFAEPEVRDKRTRNQRQHTARKARKAADKVLASMTE